MLSSTMAAFCVTLLASAAALSPSKPGVLRVSIDARSVPGPARSASPKGVADPEVAFLPDFLSLAMLRIMSAGRVVRQT